MIAKVMVAALLVAVLAGLGTLGVMYFHDSGNTATSPLTPAAESNCSAASAADSAPECCPIGAASCPHAEAACPHSQAGSK